MPVVRSLGSRTRTRDKGEHRHTLLAATVVVNEPLRRVKVRAVEEPGQDRKAEAAQATLQRGQRIDEAGLLDVQRLCKYISNKKKRAKLTRSESVHRDREWAAEAHGKNITTKINE
jgi:hypothetical protein